ncbi:MAG TPA: hypothetical protein VD735_00810 [Candidatus Saccharimonadales bacterium]|nr:hypothetical protein [Candidatus Saccharimonadales bacterium]
MNTTAFTHQQMATIAGSQADTEADTSEHSSHASQANDFLLVCPSSIGDMGVKDAIHALYYLPKQYKLVVLKDGSLVNGAEMTEGDQYLEDRIFFETATGSANEPSPFLQASAVIFNEANAASVKVNAPHIMVSDKNDSDIESDGGTGYTVATGNPEALATAAMMISKARFA